MPAPVLDRPTEASPIQRRRNVEPVIVHNGSVVFRPTLMEIGRYYWVEMDGKPYGYRKISENEVEIYGLAE